MQEALQNANDALAVIVDALKQRNRPLPPALQVAQKDSPLWIETVLAA